MGPFIYHQVMVNALVAHDFYSESNLCRCIPLPDHNTDFRRALTTSMGFVMYVETLPHNVLKVWKLLNNDDDTDSAWQLEWEIRLPFDDISYYAPLVMHPFDRNIVYLWSKQKRYLVSCNLHTQDYKIFGEDQLKRYIDDDDLENGFLHQLVRGYGTPIVISQFVLPRWMESMPCPPKLEMIDTTSLLSYISSMQKDKKK
ncbi:putative F-box/kelch-repeat protein [Cardamine amara subsp. amara]|uniref:F-box/kelch-repeat protein n=1 Tax=Cardamine amara subsp. amara TaxID=228776 RepID=A0ABD1A4C5_CARAN